MRLAGALLFLIACGHDAAPERAPPVPIVIDASPPAPFVWREDATAVVHERIVRPRDRVQELTYDLSIARAGDHVRVTLSGFRDGADNAGGTLEPRAVDRIGLVFDQPALAAGDANKALAFDVSLDGRFLGSPLVDDTLAALRSAPPGARDFADQARALIDSPAIRDGTRAHIHDLWIAWFETWRGGDRTAHVERKVTTDSDMMGGGAIFTPTGAPLAIDSRETFAIDLSAELEQPSRRPKQVTLAWSERDDGEKLATELLRIEYRFAWSR